MEESILISTKKILNVSTDDTSFDLDIITFINSAFSNLHDLGIGPIEGFSIEDDEATWADFGDVPLWILSLVKTSIFLRVRMLFDPPATSYLQGAVQRQIDEHDWRLSVNREATGWVDPNPPVVVLDGE
jgi:hypothetical protein